MICEPLAAYPDSTPQLYTQALQLWREDIDTCGRPGHAHKMSSWHGNQPGHWEDTGLHMHVLCVTLIKSEYVLLIKSWGVEFGNEATIIHQRTIMVLH